MLPHESVHPVSSKWHGPYLDAWRKALQDDTALLSEWGKLRAAAVCRERLERIVLSFAWLALRLRLEGALHAFAELLSSPIPFSQDLVATEMLKPKSDLRVKVCAACIMLTK